MFGRKLKELRLEKKINQSELGEIIGISPSTVGMYERDQRFPDKDILGKIADYFDVSIDYLLGRTNEKNPNVRNSKINIDKNKKDVEDLLEETINQILDQDGLMLNGQIIDTNDLILLRNALKNGIEYVKNMKSKK